MRPGVGEVEGEGESLGGERESLEGEVESLEVGSGVGKVVVVGPEICFFVLEPQC